jgi:hypothetical protein
MPPGDTTSLIGKLTVVTDDLMAARKEARPPPDHSNKQLQRTSE